MKYDFTILDKNDYGMWQHTVRSIYEIIGSLNALNKCAQHNIESKYIAPELVKIEAKLRTLAKDLEGE